MRVEEGDGAGPGSTGGSRDGHDTQGLQCPAGSTDTASMRRE